MVSRVAPPSRTGRCLCSVPPPLAAGPPLGLRKPSGVWTAPQAASQQRAGRVSVGWTAPRWSWSQRAAGPQAGGAPGAVQARKAEPLPPAASHSIPAFYFPRGRPKDTVDVDAVITSIERTFTQFPHERATLEDMGRVAKVSGAPHSERTKSHGAPGQEASVTGGQQAPLSPRGTGDGQEASVTGGQQAPLGPRGTGDGQEARRHRWTAGAPQPTWRVVGDSIRVGTPEVQRSWRARGRRGELFTGSPAVPAPSDVSGAGPGLPGALLGGDHLWRGPGALLHVAAVCPRLWLSAAWSWTPVSSLLPATHGQEGGLVPGGLLCGQCYPLAFRTSVDGADGAGPGTEDPQATKHQVPSGDTVSSMASLSSAWPDMCACPAPWPPSRLPPLTPEEAALSLKPPLPQSRARPLDTRGSGPFFTSSTKPFLLQAISPPSGGPSHPLLLLQEAPPTHCSSFRRPHPPAAPSSGFPSHPLLHLREAPPTHCSSFRRPHPPAAPSSGGPTHPLLLLQEAPPTRCSIFGRPLPLTAPSSGGPSHSLLRLQEAPPTHAGSSPQDPAQPLPGPLQNVALLEEEADINQLTEYFSYEHFYVIYCKFWELDTDHDLLIDAQDLARHNDHAISTKMIDRIFSGAVTRSVALSSLPSQKPGPGEGGPEGERAPGPWSSPAAPCRYEGELSPVDQKLSALRSPLAQRPFFEVPTPLGDVDLYEYACGDDDLQPL
ncbi:uncharacterized protein KIAA1522 [Marmota marmota marmota]|uniref:uncharacterized protein KIAA1522 n=1 Tax=Marmota marmota marmota TaxID=9994 RepID=UPI002092959E|nr:uncharacterized protein KIAA1522 [Marmota marmota marmota]